MPNPRIQAPWRLKVDAQHRTCDAELIPCGADMNELFGPLRCFIDYLWTITAV